ncbi:hypothetical protein [Streptomyces sp. Ncost-T10-10d]|uniref:hypothetical protein n=1 Tax=Streptomyces sp. Ncost-T10-10d TaxID=1839774 RepID=UPI00210BCA4F|nr:hypothetical protein [Streptomyces sp. Ncost-T10-10d]
MTALPRNTAPDSLPAATATAAAPAHPSTALGRMLPVEAMEAFPGRWVGGVALVLGPLLMLAGALARVRSDFFFPAQLAAYERNPGLMAISYALFGVGNLLLWPAVAVLAARIGTRSPGWGLWGGVLAMSGLFARTFHAGADHMAFRLTDAEGAEAATRVVSETYGVFQIFSALNLAILAGWLVLALGARRTRILGPVRAFALALMAALPLGVLKGTTPLSLVALVGLTAALLPMGLGMLREGPRPSRATVLRWVPLTLVTLVLMVLLGQAG